MYACSGHLGTRDKMLAAVEEKLHCRCLEFLRNGTTQVLGVNCYDTLGLVLLIRLPTAESTSQVLIAMQDASEYRAASHESLAVQKLIPFLNLCCCLRNSCFLVQSKETPPQFK
jgi:hypothetical protein